MYVRTRHTLLLRPQFVLHLYPLVQEQVSFFQGKTCSDWRLNTCVAVSNDGEEMRAWDSTSRRITCHHMPIFFLTRALANLTAPSGRKRKDDGGDDVPPASTRPQLAVHRCRFVDYIPSAVTALAFPPSPLPRPAKCTTTKRVARKNNLVEGSSGGDN